MFPALLVFLTLKLLLFRWGRKSAQQWGERSNATQTCGGPGGVQAVTLRGDNANRRAAMLCVSVHVHVRTLSLVFVQKKMISEKWHASEEFKYVGVLRYCSRGMVK